MTTMLPFLEKIFPLVLRKAAEAKTNMYFIYDGQVLTCIASIEAKTNWLLAASLRQLIDETRMFGGVTFLAGAAINGAAANIAMLILGRILLGFGVGFTNQQPNTTRQSGADTLCKVRGKGCDVESELKNANDIAKVANQEPFVTIFERQYRPHLVMPIAIPYFQQLTGINIIAFYPPVLFQSAGFRNNSALIVAIILGLVNLASILVSTGIVDRFGRRFFFMEGRIQMFVCQVGVAMVLAVTTGVSGKKEISKGYAIVILVLTCIDAAGFCWSWGPLSWRIPSEIFPNKIRPPAKASERVIKTVFFALFLPETKGVSLFEVNGLIPTLIIT
ncbi:hypothetical protein V6N11_078008 [Hibiscus sabdariffa]|uniref:Major facilitator superfamily (MFS) profile domain-containing protein n=1 Tax=Hibiscus sabdariffa TaxID=183260 RepID=A0ABR2TER8_9ROSI